MLCTGSERMDHLFDVVLQSLISDGLTLGTVGMKDKDSAMESNMEV